MKSVKESISFESLKLPKITKERCMNDNCGRRMQLDPVTEQPFCFYCKHIAAEDKILAQQTIEAHARMTKRKVKDVFDQNSLINENLKKATFETYIPPSKELVEAKQKVRDFARLFNPNEAKNLLLVGTYGTGKSHLSFAVTKFLLDAGFSCLFLSVPKLLTKIKETYNSKSKLSEEDLFEYIQQVDLLVLDDLGAEYTNKRNENDNWAQTKIFEVVDSRAGKSTIYTTNLRSADLEAKVNERNFSRILDNTEIIKMNGKDYRRKQF